MQYCDLRNNVYVTIHISLFTYPNYTSTHCKSCLRSVCADRACVLRPQLFWMLGVSQINIMEFLFYLLCCKRMGLASLCIYLTSFFLFTLLHSSKAILYCHAPQFSMKELHTKSRDSRKPNRINQRYKH